MAGARSSVVAGRARCPAVLEAAKKVTTMHMLLMSPASLFCAPTQSTFREYSYASSSFSSFRPRAVSVEGYIAPRGSTSQLCESRPILPNLVQRWVQPSAQPR
jgi:hypothetical protein